MAAFQPLPPSSASPRTFIRPGTNASAPTILLLGWADAPLKYVQKYAGIYPVESTILVQLSRFSDFLLSDHSLAKLSAPVLTQLCNQPPQPQPQPSRPHNTPPPSPPSSPTPLPPLVVHLFSNGGALLFHALRVSAQISHLQLQITGITIDSAPSEGRLWDGAKLLSRVATNGGPLRHLLFVITIVFMLLHRLLQVLSGRPTLFNSIWQALANPGVKCTRLVLYSEADALVGSRAVDKFVVYARGRGVDVVTRCWQDSAHVRHYVDHGEEYRALVHQHVLSPACEQLQ